MSTLPLFYKNIVPLNKNIHGAWSLEKVSDYKHTSETNSLYVAAIEFMKIACEYPIVFCLGSDGAIFPVVILGLRKDENLYINKAGQWLANYIPAYIRRYPFILASDKSISGEGTDQETPEKFTVCIDSDWKGFNTKEKGEQLFDLGNESEMLQKSIDFLKEYQLHVEKTQDFCAKLKELSVLESMQATVKLSNGENISLGGFLGVNRKKIKDLDKTILSYLVEKDYMELIYAHFTSLNNLELLGNRCAKQGTGGRVQ
ncbi:SapC-like S-layer protein [uncultured Candidatus Thioglobus sp.]|nr:SapC-like S-layer protein [uncultured Candidatus Thioglobus sp.]